LLGRSRILGRRRLELNGSPCRPDHPELASESVGRSVGEARILSPPDSPRTLTLRHDQDLAAPNDLVGGPFVSGQRAVEPHDRRIRADEGQLFEPFALNAIAEHRLVYCGVTFLDRGSSFPHLARPENLNAVFMEQAGQRAHVVAVPRSFPAVDDGRNLFPISSIAGLCTLGR
jgi:hypothetical protein